MKRSLAASFLLHRSPTWITHASRGRLLSNTATSYQEGERTTTTKSTGKFDKFSMSHEGLHPTLNRFHCPLVYHERYSFENWPESQTFPMDKFARLANAVLTTCKSNHPESPLPRPLVKDPHDFYRPLDFEDIPIDDWFCGPIESGFVHRFLQGKLTVEECRHIGFREQTCRPELIERTVLEVAGTVLTAQLALEYGIAANLAGGTHHANMTGGAGYTILNDFAVTTHVLCKDEDLRVSRVLVIDCDVHQGDGTAKFGNSVLKDKLFTLSLHCASNYPRPKAHSTYDVGLPDGMKDDEYLQVLRESVNRAIAEVQPDLILYDAGVDVYEGDKLGRLKLSEAGIRQRDRWVLDTCVSKGIPVAGE